MALPSQCFHLFFKYLLINQMNDQIMQSLEINPEQMHRTLKCKRKPSISHYSYQVKFFRLIEKNTNNYVSSLNFSLTCLGYVE